MHLDWPTIREITSYSMLTCAQQSVMNFGILMIQGLINSFGTAVMAAFAAAVKIDSFAYMPVQDFGNAFSTFIAQNFGAKQTDRIRRGIRSAIMTTTVFCVIISVLVFLFARPLMLIFVRPDETEIISIGVQYLRVEGVFYCGIGLSFPVVRFLPCSPKTGDVRGIDGHFSGNSCYFGLRVGKYSVYRCRGNLVGYSYRLVLG